MNWKLVIVGGLVFWVVSIVIGMFGTGLLIHERLLDPVYRANSQFWLPALNQDPPDMAALMPQWLASSLISSLVFAGIYAKVRGSFQGPGWKRGLSFALILVLFNWAYLFAWSGVFNLPAQLWIWWGIDALIIYLISGIAMGWAGGKWAPA